MPQVVINYSLKKLSCGVQDEEKARKHEQTSLVEKNCDKDKKTGGKEKGNLRVQLHLMRCFVYMLSEGYVFTACMGTFLACSQTFFFLLLPPPPTAKIWGPLNEAGSRFFLSYALSTISKVRIEGLWTNEKKKKSTFGNLAAFSFRYYGLFRRAVGFWARRRRTIGLTVLKQRISSWSY